jgi:hypothetical protein
MTVTGIGMITGHWQNDITKNEYLIHYKYMNTYGHPTGTAAVKKFNKEAAKEAKSESGKILKSELNK